MKKTKKLKDNNQQLGLTDLFDLKKIDEGSFSKIHTSKTKGNQIFVIKEFKKSQKKSSDYYFSHFDCERRSLEVLTHPFIRKYYGNYNVIYLYFCSIYF